MLSIKVENFISQDAVAIFNGYSWEKVHTSNCYLKGDDGNLISYIHEEELGPCYDIAYNDVLANVYTHLSKNKVEQLANKKLKSIASFYRIYGPKCVLKIHVDKPAYDYTVTINISNNPDNHRWPIYTETQKLILNPGDAFVCEGNKVIHWREEHQGQWSTQLMLHYQIDE